MSFNVHLLKTTSFIPPTMSEGASYDSTSCQHVSFA